MKQLNEQATRIFCRLIKKLNAEQHIKLFSEGFMPLSMERLEENILTPAGVATTYSLCHYYKQNGDLMRDPEMVFIVVDNRKDEKDMKAVHIYPQLYRQDSLGLYEESIRIDNGLIKSFIKTWLDGHCAFANQWLRNIQVQGFI
jgi:hypothetical protein